MVFTIIFLSLIISCLAADYDVAASRQFAVLAGLAFCDKPCLQAWSCGASAGLDVSQVTRIEGSLTKAAGYVGYYASRNLIVASYRGSNNIQNWIEDFNFEKVPYLYCLKCEIHAGFYADYLLLEPAINAKVEQLLQSHPGAGILTTGHSLGAAIAEISALQLLMKFGRPTSIHNFGAPRIGNVHLSRHINNKISSVFRVVHNRDLVPHLPPDLPPFEYHHPAFEVFFNEEMTDYKVCSYTGEDISCSNKFSPNYDPNDHDFYFIHISQTKC